MSLASTLLTLLNYCIWIALISFIHYTTIVGYFEEKSNKEVQAEQKESRNNIYNRSFETVRGETLKKNKK
jgi:hypothetical protein